MDHNNKHNIICPYCDYEDNDSWEFGHESGTHACGRCAKEFDVEVTIDISYSTSKIYCKRDNHEYTLKELFISKLDYKNEFKPESEWNYYKIMICKKCDSKNYITITKDEYEQIEKRK